MSKIEINKEVILMRKNVDQAKIHIIKKHTRDAMKLRTKKGTDVQKEKNKRKADRIAAEILAIKKVKNDEVTKHILTHTLNLEEILNNRESDALTRMMARIANHKVFSKKIAEFKEKYPKYMEFLGPGRKKKAIMEWKEKKKQKNKGVEEEEAASDKSSKNEKSEESSEGKDERNAESSNESIVNNTEQPEKENKESKKKKAVKKEVPANDVKNKVKKAKKVSEEPEKTETLETAKPEKSQKRKKVESEIKEDAPSPKKSKKKKNDIPKVISKQAVVKKFTDILKEDESNVDKEEIDSEPAEPSIQVEKEEDPFFVTGDGQSNYLSVAPVRNKSDNQQNDDDDNEDDYRQNRFNKKKIQRQDPDKYFSNVSSNFKNGNLKKSDARWSDAPKRNGKEKPGRNANFSKFNDERRDKSKPFNGRQSKGGIESTSNEILHPSWEAKKKQQEALKKGFQGKKIVFGDDGV